MIGCNHKTRYATWPVRFHSLDGTITSISVSASVCVGCGAPLPIGDSDEAPVVDEIRAAELALSDAEPGPEDVQGALSYVRDEAVATGAWAGWLATAIQIHDRIVVELDTPDPHPVIHVETDDLDGVDQSEPDVPPDVDLGGES